MSTKVLHVVGSPDSTLYHELSIYYACERIKAADDLKFYYAVVHPDKLWSFHSTLSSGQTFDTKRHEFLTIDKAMSEIRNIKPDVVVWHMFCARGFTVYRALVEALNIPIIGASSETAFITQNKAIARGVVQQNGVRIPKGVTVHQGEIDVSEIHDRIGLPFVVKPARCGDSKGVTLVREKSQLEDALKAARQLDDIAIVEKFISGREIRTGVISDKEGNLKMLPPVQYIDVKPEEIKGFEKTFTKGFAEGLPEGKNSFPRTRFLEEEHEAADVLQNLKESSFKAFKALGLRDFAIFDFRVDGNGLPWLLEINVVCSFQPKSWLSKMAAQVGISCQTLLKQMIDNALSRKIK